MNFVTQSPTSVEPATMVAPGSLSIDGGEIIDMAGTMTLAPRTDLDPRAVLQASSLIDDRLRSATSGSLPRLPIAGDGLAARMIAA
jgi:hypothetical protein